uniref:Thioredoxin domain-containing protein n=1 Tax=viral metagenome TaxID=1070528 RepID=A0A6C0D8Q7_9ZZZZ
MKYLETQEQFEELIGRIPVREPLPSLTVIWFSAAWCGPCKKIQINKLMSDFPANWLKCDVDQNNYTAGFCGIRSVPTFMVIYNTKILETKASSDTNEILQWLNSLLTKN